jgi:hypothetical protein
VLSHVSLLAGNLGIPNTAARPEVLQEITNSITAAVINKRFLFIW